MLTTEGKLHEFCIRSTLVQSSFEWSDIGGPRKCEAKMITFEQISFLMNPVIQMPAPKKECFVKTRFEGRTIKGRLSLERVMSSVCSGNSTSVQVSIDTGFSKKHAQHCLGLLHKEGLLKRRIINSGPSPKYMYEKNHEPN